MNASERVERLHHSPQVHVTLLDGNAFPSEIRFNKEEMTRTPDLKLKLVGIRPSCGPQDLANNAAARMAALEAELKKTAAEIEEETRFQLARVAELAKSTAERIRHDAVVSTAALAEAAKRRVRARLAQSAANLARDLIGRDFQRDDQGRLIDGFMEQLGSGPRPGASR